MNLPAFIDTPSAFNGEHSQAASANPIATAGTNPIEPAMPGLYCALHAAVCLGLTENPGAAGLCWVNFASRCSVID